MPSHNVKQALLIPSARFLPNNNGTAPGWWAEKDGTIIVTMPGPPVEMQAIFQEEVEPRLRERVTGQVTITRNVKTMGMSEGAVDEVMSEFFGHENPYLGIYSKADGIHLRVIARAADEAAARGMIVPVEAAIHERLGSYIWGYDDETPEQSLGQSLQARGQTLAVMEFCTGGFLTNAITEAKDAGRHFKGGIVASGSDSLAAMGVPPVILENHGAVSQETANAMAVSALAQLGATYGIGIRRRPRPRRTGRTPDGPGLHRHRPGHRRRPASRQGIGAPRPAPPDHHQAPYLQPGIDRAAQAGGGGGNRTVNCALLLAVATLIFAASACTGGQLGATSEHRRHCGGEASNNPRNGPSC